MPKTNYDSSSPYYETGQTNWFLLPIRLRAIPADGTDKLMSSLPAKYHNRPDLLAYDLYGSPAYWWVFMVRNIDDIRDPIWSFQQGMSFYYPTAERLHELLG